MDISEEDLKAKIAEAVSNAVKPLKSENTSLLAKNKEILDEKKKISAEFKKFDGLDIENLKKIQGAFDSSEDAKLIADGKLDEVVSRRVEKQQLEFDTKTTELTDSLTKSNESNAALTKRYNSRVINDSIAKVAAAEKVLPTAVEDIQRRAQDVFSVDDDGSVVSRDKDGHITKETPEKFVKGLKETAGHYWPSNVSADLSGNDKDAAAAEAADKGDVASYIAARKSDSKAA